MIAGEPVTPYRIPETTDMDPTEREALARLGRLVPLPKEPDVTASFLNTQAKLGPSDVARRALVNASTTGNTLPVDHPHQPPPDGHKLMEDAAYAAKMGRRPITQVE